MFKKMKLKKNRNEIFKINSFFMFVMGLITAVMAILILTIYGKGFYCSLDDGQIFIIITGIIFLITSILNIMVGVLGFKLLGDKKQYSFLAFLTLIIIIGTVLCAFIDKFVNIFFGLIIAQLIIAIGYIINLYRTKK